MGHLELAAHHREGQFAFDKVKRIVAEDVIAPALQQRQLADSGGEQLFRALKYLKRPTAMVVFPRETHELSRSGEPWHRIERLDHIVGWFDRYLMGVPHPEYDVLPEAHTGKTASAGSDR